MKRKLTFAAEKRLWEMMTERPPAKDFAFHPFMRALWGTTK